ncbi:MULTISPECIES: alpha/beta fold hydrolase [Rhizobium/Agrobacterium group]|uniref:alpha/beta fold hydrolase n=1 Tax=Rhizobium/Agrobacterium group TaxID=227290 RepID=UPI0008FB44B5|nr:MULTISPECIES: alpha/beta hydrolase [Rhizobium/Agrobacterium group]MCF1464848.1 alpha/beta hydrolase [Allorhizobium ampelinum]MCF1496013.1 alpha/beta hydrolase [Allorhizobium ampelinum]MUZ55550.1 alpha/beta fold hydrolase [Agrobacterium vitis]MUZ94774.1 alpha/beta fold hydrolase [Agrobacterium vitis]MVA43152.1 alpha/beta fold hydrolase [Agrobacterium vitis]
MFDGFQLMTVETSFGHVRLRTGGRGPTLVLLHGHPRTHMTWGQVADLLAPSYTVVCPDLPGFGGSYIPEDTPDSSGSSKRQKAVAMVEVMRKLGHERFSVVGHDRGSYTAFRMAMDHPAQVQKLIVVDCLPIIEHLERADWKFARDWYHWFFFAQAETPERVICADPISWYNGLSPDLMGEAAYEDVVQAINTPGVIHGMIEDYRAGLRVDHFHDRADRDAGRRVQCPVLCLWSLDDDLEQIYGNPLDIWQHWAKDLRGFGIQAGHHIAEENPRDLAKAISAFL